ncbi:trophoblast-specific protein alpha-like [Arvicanthis niloticus]|uniref:trophoblast-specific protein alpha-like n=1 Tax=Arvicanthis niloticus TaxID=61156 RepID=UPI00148707BF|nr:trophoblast-specific protein alpha-like [Arvicanthis niloticus]XP_034366090.1 trophoblast-specific protein alpha-like [Arvicanthis niloticus]
MTPTVFLVILCLGVASAAIVSDPSSDAELQEQKDKKEPKTVSWDELIKAITQRNGENDEDVDGLNIEMSAFGELADEEFIKIVTKILQPKSGKEKNQTSEFEDLEESGDEFPDLDQPE